LQNDQKKNYYRNLEIGFISSLLLGIFLFYFFPVFYPQISEIARYEPVIEILNVPLTEQKNQNRPPPSRPMIPVPAEEMLLLDPVKIYLDDSESLSDSLMRSEFMSGLPKGYRPRQILEVVPQTVNEAYSGEIVLQLKIGKKGQVIDYRIIINTTQSQDCLNNAIEAAKKSLWEAAIVNGNPVEYWIEKVYRFNM
jgi:hypothetical protein